MDSGKLAVIHASDSIPWHKEWSKAFAQGFANLGIPYRVTDSRTRIDGTVPVLLGTSLWRAIEASGEFLLVDRASFNNPTTWATLVWNGHGRRGEFRIPENYGSMRWRQHGVELEDWKRGLITLLCGQTETFSPKWASLEKWYYACLPIATHFRPHPHGSNETHLPIHTTWESVSKALVLNSSVGVEALMRGVEVIAYDEAFMGYGVSRETREEWCHWLAWTQYHISEIRTGLKHVFD